MTVVETERLVMRRMTANDAAFMLALLNEPAFLRNIGDRGVRTLDDARAYILDRVVDSYERFGYGMFLAEIKDDGTPVGAAGLVNRDELDDVDIGFAFLPGYWGRGYATEASGAVLDYARRELGLERVVGVVAPDNHGSIRVLEKLGLRYERDVQLSEDDIWLRLYGDRL